MKVNRAFWSGLFGGILISLLLGLARFADLADLHLEMLVGTFATEPGMNAFSIGMAMHLLFAGLLGLLYARIFEALSRAGAGAGALVGLIHAVVVGLILGLIHLVHPQMPEAMTSPGFFALGYGGLDFVALVVTHVGYGVLLGVLYGPPLSTGAVGYKEV